MKLFLVALASLSVTSTTTAFAPPSSSLVRKKGPGNTLFMGKDDLKLPDMPTMPDISVPDIGRIADSFADFNVGTVVENLTNGDELGNRGEVYFAAQAALVLCVLIGGVPLVGGTLKALLGSGLLLGGAALTVLSLADLGSDSLSPFLKPTKTIALKTTGIYSEIRHPLYTGLVATLFGFSVLTASVDRVLLTALLLYLVEVKSEKEEKYLIEQFPNEYPAYMAAVPGKFFPASIAKQLPWGNDE